MMVVAPKCPPILAALRVLVVEDSLLHQTLAASLLKKQGYSVKVTSNGKEAIEALEVDNFDFVLMDVEMPVMNGLEATRLIREGENTTGKHLPVIAVTSTADPDVCLAAGMDAFLTKPLTAAMLQQVLQEVLGDWRPRKPR
jgi:CheY-like chemotaxis protein